VKVQALKADVDEVRSELSALVAELDRRRHDLLDVRIQLRRNAWPLGLTSLAVGATAAAAIALGTRRARRRKALAGRALGVGQAVGRLLDHPERVAVVPSVPERIATAAASAAAVYVVKAVLDRVLGRR
jgi:hypothetical protein